VAFEANHCEDKKRQKALDNLFAKTDDAIAGKE
jgi:hypothetical protein